MAMHLGVWISLGAAAAASGAGFAQPDAAATDPQVELVEPIAELPSDADSAPSASTRCELTTLEAPPPLSITAQQGVGAAVRQANACVNQGDAACAETALTSVQALTLSDDERAILAIPRADLATLRGDNAAAEGVYREAVALPAIGDSLRREVVWRLALLLNTRGEFAEALRGLDSSFDWRTSKLPRGSTSSKGEQCLPLSRRSPKI